MVDPASPCVTFGPEGRTYASVDLKKSLEAQGQGFILRKSGEPSAFLTPERKNWF